VTSHNFSYSKTPYIIIIQIITYEKQISETGEKCLLKNEADYDKINDVTKYLNNNIDRAVRQKEIYMIKCVIFDMDGTIGNTLPLCIAAFRRSIRETAGITVSDQDIIDTFGPSEEGTIMALIPAHYEEGLKEYQTQYKKLHHVITPEPFGGIKDVFDLIRRKDRHIALVTGKARTSLDITLEVFDMEGCFDAIETGSPSGPNKPHGIRSVLKDLGLKPEEAVYIGDAPSDILSSKSVNVPVISAAWDEHADVDALTRLEPDKIIYSIGELKRYLAEYI